MVLSPSAMVRISGVMPGGQSARTARLPWETVRMVAQTCSTDCISRPVIAHTSTAAAKSDSMVTSTVATSRWSIARVKEVQSSTLVTCQPLGSLIRWYIASSRLSSRLFLATKSVRLRLVSYRFSPIREASGYQTSRPRLSVMNIYFSRPSPSQFSASVRSKRVSSIPIRITASVRLIRSDRIRCPM